MIADDFFLGNEVILEEFRLVFDTAHPILNTISPMQMMATAKKRRKSNHITGIISC